LVRGERERERQTDRGRIEKVKEGRVRMVDGGREGGREESQPSVKQQIGGSGAKK
jgi:hypothetical protein